MAWPAMPNKNLFISTYSGFILCLFRYKFGDKPFTPILTVTQWQSPIVLIVNNFNSGVFHLEFSDKSGGDEDTGGNSDGGGKHKKQ